MDYKKVYKDIFANPSYSVNADRKFSCEIIHNYITDEKSAIDIGSGRGPVLIELKKKISSEKILSCDLENFHGMSIPFEELNLTVEEDRKKILTKYISFDFLTCLDVLEHIEEIYLNEILQFFKKIAKKFFIIVANHSDIHNGIELHITQKPLIWWEGLFKKYFEIIEKKSIHNGRAYIFVMV